MKTQLKLFLLNLLTSRRFLIYGAFAAWLSVFSIGRAQTVVWSENFDDGNGNSRWYADAGVWQIGSPTIGPETNSARYRTHSGADCATTGLTENYPTGMNSRWIRIQTFAVPAAKQYPRLRFWHWYSFAGGGEYGGPDYGVVEVRVGTGAWQAISPTYTGFSGDWTYASVDLSTFAGQTVQLAFHAVYANDGGGTSTGWYVDDISLLTGTPVFNNPEGFEGGIGDWYAEQGIWQVGSPTKSGGAPADSLNAQAYAGTNCAVTLLGANYPTGMNSRFISPLFVLPAASLSPNLRFWHWYNFAGGGEYGGPDYGVVEIKSGTNLWQTLSPQYEGNSENWSEPFIDLTSFGGQTVQLAFYAVYANNGGGRSQGWYVDNIQVFPYATAVSGLSVLSAIPNTNINDQALWQYTPAVSGSGYTFGLSNAPSGMAVDASLGAISWTPTQQQATYTYSNITYIVYQSAAPIALTNFNVTVNDVNVAPALTVPGQQLVYATTTLTVTNTATESDIWATSLAFGLVSAPPGVLLNANTGVLTWTPTTGQAPSTNIIAVSVTDYDSHAVNNQNLSVTSTFNVIVEGLTPPSFTLQPVSQVVGADQPVTFTASATGYPAPTYQWQFNGVNISDATGGSYSILSTGVTNIGYYTVVASNSDGTNTSSRISLTFLNLNMYAGLNIVGPIGANYTIQSTPSLEITDWITLTNVSLPTQPYIYIDYNSPTNSRQFYRAIPQ